MKGDAGAAQHFLGLAAARRWHQQDTDALAAGAAGAAAAMLQHLGVVGQVGVDHQRQARQVNTAGRDVGGNADLGPPVAQGLQRMVALGLAQFAR